jgi:C-terminal processing protease CtpA/Prc
MEILLARSKIFDKGSNLRLAMTDGTEVDVPGVEKPEYVNRMAKFPVLNRHKAGFKTRMLTDSTACLGIATFGLNQVQVETIRAFLDSISRLRVPNLVIDVRNNGGGHDWVISKLYSYIAGEPMTLHGFSRVGSNTTYRTFAHSVNQIPDSQPFADHRPEEGREGFYQRSESGNVVRADSLVNYKGRIYMLTNENSVSAATIFPALLVRNHRGVTVGRETRGAYHFMNAVKFVELRLPSSQIVVRLPLVETHFDDVVNERVPYGRGVMPDYPVALTLEELISDGDTMLDYTLGLIERGEYFSDNNPFADDNPFANGERNRR